MTSKDGHCREREDEEAESFERERREQGKGSRQGTGERTGEARRDSVNDAALHYSRTYASKTAAGITLSTKAVACPRNTDGKPGSGHEAGEINKNADVGNDGQQHLWEEWEQEQGRRLPH